MGQRSGAGKASRVGFHKCFLRHWQEFHDFYANSKLLGQGDSTTAALIGIYLGRCQVQEDSVTGGEYMPHEQRVTHRNVALIYIYIYNLRPTSKSCGSLTGTLYYTRGFFVLFFQIKSTPADKFVAIWQEGRQLFPGVYL